MTPSTTYYLVRSFPRHSVYSRRFRTVNKLQPYSSEANAIELWAILRGLVHDDQSQLTASPNSLLVFRRDVDLENIQFRLSSDCHVLGCCIGQILQELSAEEVMYWQPDDADNTFLLPCPISNHKVQQKIIENMKSILTQARTTDPLRHEKCRLLFSRIMYLLNECALSTAIGTKKHRQSQQQLCNAAKYYIRKNLHQGIIANEMAENLKTSYSSLCKAFAICEGMTLIEYTNREKIKLAIVMITEGGMTLAEAAQALSISSPSYLSRMFRRYTGKTATMYKTGYSADSGTKNKT